MELTPAEHRVAFARYLRTGRWPNKAQATEHKFNPYHDPRNGRFTFAPGGPRSLAQVVVSDRRSLGVQRGSGSAKTSSRQGASPFQASEASVNTAAATELAGLQLGGRPPRRSNSQAFQDPLTLQHVFPGLQSSPGGAIIAAIDDFLDVTGPARALTADLTRRLSNKLINDIKAIDPTYRFDSLSSPKTLEGQISQLNGTLRTRCRPFQS